MHSVFITGLRFPGFRTRGAARARFYSSERRPQGRAGFIKSWRRTARLDDDGDADTFVSAFSPRAVATAPVVADT